METHTVNILVKLEQVSLQSPWGMGAPCHVKKEGWENTTTPRLCEIMSVLGALSRTGGLGVLGRVCSSLASVL